MIFILTTVYLVYFSLSLQISNLEVFTEYAVVVQAFNKIGQGPMSEEALVHTAEGAPTKPPEDVSLVTLSSQQIKVRLRKKRNIIY